MHVHHEFRIGRYRAARLEIPDAVERRNPVGVGIVQLASVEEGVGVGFGIVWLDDAEAYVVERHRFRRIVIDDDALVYGEFARPVVFLTTSIIQLLYKYRVGCLHGCDADW